MPDPDHKQQILDAATTAYAEFRGRERLMHVLEVASLGLDTGIAHLSEENGDHILAIQEMTAAKAAVDELAQAVSAHAITINLKPLP